MASSSLPRLAVARASLVHHRFAHGGEFGIVPDVAVNVIPPNGISHVVTIMDERMTRLWAGAEADGLGHGGITIVERATGPA
jgi:hypothetical protein